MKHIDIDFFSFRSILHNLILRFTQHQTVVRTAWYVVKIQLRNEGFARQVLIRHADVSLDFLDMIVLYPPKS